MTSQNNQAGLPLPGFGNAANTRHTGRRSSRRPFFPFYFSKNSFFHLKKNQTMLL